MVVFPCHMDKKGDHVKSWKLVVIVLVLMVASSCLGYWIHSRLAEAQAAEARHREEVAAAVQKVINDLKVPPEALFVGFAARQEIGQIRRDALAAGGIRDFCPYRNQVEDEAHQIRFWEVSSLHDVLAGGSSLPTTPKGPSSRAYASQIHDVACEDYWLNKAGAAANTIERWYNEPKSEYGNYLRQHVELYEKEIRWRLVDMMHCAWPLAQLAACKTLAAAGDRSDDLRHTLEQIWQPDSEYDYVGKCLEKCGWPVPVGPASQPAYQEQVARHDQSGRVLPPGAVIRFVCTSDPAQAATRPSVTEPRNYVKLLGLSANDTIINALCDSKIYRWNLTSHQLLPSSLPEKVEIDGAAVDAATDTLATTGRGSVRLWNLNTGELLAQLSADTGGQMRYHPRGRLIVSSSDTTSVWNADTKKLIYRSGQSLWNITCLPGDRMWFAGLGADQTIQVIDELNWQNTYMKPQPQNRALPTEHLALSSDGKALLSVGYGKAAIWQVGKRPPLQLKSIIRLSGYDDFRGSIQAIVWVPEHDLAFMSLWKGDNSIFMIDLRTGKTLGRLLTHDATAQSMLRSGDWLYTGGKDRAVLVWDLRPIIDWCDSRREKASAATTTSSLVNRE